jgi:hypothetical protein
VNPRKASLIELKKKAGLATPAEIDALDNAPVVSGDDGSLVTPRPARDAASWAARWDRVPGHDLYAANPVADEEPAAAGPLPPLPDDEPPAPPAPSAPGVTYYADGTMQCAPGDEPPPAGRPGYRPPAPERPSLRDRLLASAGRGNSLRRLGRA